MNFVLVGVGELGFLDGLGGGVVFTGDGVVVGVGLGVDVGVIVGITVGVIKSVFVAAGAIEVSAAGVYAVVVGVVVGVAGAFDTVCTGTFEGVSLILPEYDSLWLLVPTAFLSENMKTIDAGNTTQNNTAIIEILITSLLTLDL